MSESGEWTKIPLKNTISIGLLCENCVNEAKRKSESKTILYRYRELSGVTGQSALMLKSKVTLSSD